MKNLKGLLRVFIMTGVYILFLMGCNRHKTSKALAYERYISGYTSGILSKTSFIQVKLSDLSGSGHKNNEEAGLGIFDFDPAVEGKAYWVGNKTIEFRPDHYLEPGKSYHVNFNLSKVFKVPDSFSRFYFDVAIINPSYAVENDGLESVGSALDRMKLKGVLSTVDYEAPAQIEKMLSATLGNQPLAVRWVHPKTGNDHFFYIDNIAKDEKPSELRLMWSGTAINASKNGNSSIAVPQKGEFKVLDVVPEQDSEQYTRILFSNPLQASQNLDGLVRLSRYPNDLRYAIHGSVLKVYTPENIEGSQTVTLLEGIRDIAGKRLQNDFAKAVTYKSPYPSVALLGKGNIIPGEGKLALPFEAINLNAIDVFVLKTFESNVPFFLQKGTLNSTNTYNLQSFAIPVTLKTVRLDEDPSINLHKKNRFSIDLSTLFKKEPGALYTIQLRFNKAYSIYSYCKGDPDKKPISDNENGQENEITDEDGQAVAGGVDEFGSFWNKFNDRYPKGYDYELRDNPCSRSFYDDSKWPVINVLASNMGIIAKKGADKSFFVMVNHLLTTAPMANIYLELIDYQGQVVGTAKTNAQGIAEVSYSRKPYLLKAKNNEERGYLELSDQKALEMSRFDVSGEVVQKGVKGFIYGDRGVWRPGDSIFLTFILENKGNPFPADMPINFELYNPTNGLTKKMVSTGSKDGFYLFRMKTEPGDPTGHWTARVKAGGAVFEKSLSIETIMPNRLKIALDFSGKQEINPFENTTGTLSSRWLFGGVPKKLKASVYVTLASDQTSFKNFSSFIFDDPAASFNPEGHTIEVANLDEKGESAVNVQITPHKNPPGKLRADFLIKVFEPGGSFSIDNESYAYNYFKSYVGVSVPKAKSPTERLLTNTRYPVQIVNVDPKGSLLPGSRRVEVNFYKLKWSWWWEKSALGLTDLAEDKHNQLLKTDTLSLSDGKGLWNLIVPYPDWGRYLVRVKDLQSGHITGETVYVDWPGWSERTEEDNTSEASLLSFSTDKNTYQAGEKVTLTIPSAKGGHALVSIESGSKIYNTYYVETTQGQTKFNFEATPEMSPNVYATVTLVQPHGQKTDDAPIRMYGAVPIFIENPKTKLQPVISMKSSLVPEAVSHISISEKSGAEMTYTLAIVDDGLLDLTHFKTPDPRASFYAREALGVSTWDVYENVLGNWTTELEHMLGIGGDGQATNRNAPPAKANRFKPVVICMGPFHLNKGETKTHAFKLPPYIGSVRVMLVSGHGGAYGFAEKTVAVKKPLMVLATLPRVAGPEETIALPVTVFGMDPSVKRANVKISTNPYFSVDGSASQTVSFDSPGERMLDFKLHIRAQTGVGKVRVEVTSGAQTATYEVQMDIRNPNPYLTRVLEKTIPPGGIWQASYTPMSLAGGTVTLEASNLPAINLKKRLDYLINYPNGCLEQVTSTAFPQLVLDRLTDLTVNEKQKITLNVKSAIEKIRRFQTAGGGFSYWPGLNLEDDWASSYAANFLMEAQKYGYAVPNTMLVQWKKYARNQALAWQPTYRYFEEDLAQAYRLYLLALSGSSELGAMNRLKELRNLSPQAKWRLAAAYQISGQPEVASKMVNGLPIVFPTNHAIYFTYGSNTRDQAMVLETLTLLHERARALAVLKDLAAGLSGNDWYSTQTTAYALLAIARYCGSAPSPTRLNFTYTQQSTGSKHIMSASYYAQALLTRTAVTDAKIEVKNNGLNTLYVKIIEVGQAPAGKVLAANGSEALTMKVDYANLDGSPVDVKNMAQGTDFAARVILSNPFSRGPYYRMALTQIFPSGWEIINTRLLAGEQGGFQSSESTYKDIRDDRVLTYFDLPQKQSVTYYVVLNAAYRGHYFMPPVSCEAMYDGAIHASGVGQWVDVVKQNPIP